MQKDNNKNYANITKYGLMLLINKIVNIIYSQEKRYKMQIDYPKNINRLSNRGGTVKKFVENFVQIP